VVTLGVPPELQPALDAHRRWIADEVLATEVIDGNGDHTIELDGIPVQLSLRLAD